MSSWGDIIDSRLESQSRSSKVEISSWVEGAVHYRWDTSWWPVSELVGHANGQMFILGERFCPVPGWIAHHYRPIWRSIPSCRRKYSVDVRFHFRPLTLLLDTDVRTWNFSFRGANLKKNRLIFCIEWWPFPLLASQLHLNWLSFDLNPISNFLFKRPTESAAAAAASIRIEPESTRTSHSTIEIGGGFFCRKNVNVSLQFLVTDSRPIFLDRWRQPEVWHS